MFVDTKASKINDLEIFLSLFVITPLFFRIMVLLLCHNLKNRCSMDSKNLKTYVVRAGLLTATATLAYGAFTMMNDAREENIARTAPEVERVCRLALQAYGEAIKSVGDVDAPEFENAFNQAKQKYGLKGEFHRARQVFSPTYDLSLDNLFVDPRCFDLNKSAFSNSILAPDGVKPK